VTPITFNGVFGWLHEAAGASNHGVAILLCSGLNHDALNAYHAHRLLAEQLAESGYPTLRFDYPHTGDSEDVDGLDANPGIDLWQIWLDSVNEAADILRRSTGASSLVLCGLRIGAMLAALTAEKRDDVVGLVLLAPVVKGQSYLRQIWIEAQLHDRTIPPIKDGILFQDIYFNQKTVGAMGAADLRDAVFSSNPKIAVFAQSQSRLLDECCSAWASRGRDVFRAGFAGLEPMLSMNVEDNKGHPNFDRLLDWVRQAVQKGEGLPAARLPYDEAVLTPPGCIETPLRFGDDSRLFGILCQPANEPTTEIVLILNAGRDPRHSPGRFNVEFSRQLAQKGIAALRFDFSGLGDSLGPPGQESKLSSLLDLERSGDVSAAIDALTPLGFRNFTAYGLCAGAYHAMQSAVADSRISRLLLINIPVFSWSSGERIDFIRHKNLPFRYYFAELIRLKSWSTARQKLQKSGSVLRGQALRLSTKLANAPWSPLIWLDRLGGLKLTAGQKNMAILSRRRVKTLLLFGEGDLGLDAVTQEFGAINAAPALGENVTLRVVAEFDHLVSHERTRRSATLCMLTFLENTGDNLPRYAAQTDIVPQAQESLSN